MSDRHPFENQIWMTREEFAKTYPEEGPMPTQHEIDALRDAVWQLLDDMGHDLCVSITAKAQARIAYEPFRMEDDPLPMTLEEAKAIWDER